MPDLSTYNWQELFPATPPPQRDHPGMVWAGDQIILFGGRYFNGTTTTYYDDTWTFDTTSKEWTELSPATTPPTRSGPVMVWDETNERVLMYGGQVGSGTAVRKDLYEYAIGGDWSLVEANGPINPAVTNRADQMWTGVWDTANDRLLLNIGWVIVSPASSTNRLYEWTSGGGWVQLSPTDAMELDVSSGSPDPNPRALFRQAATWDPSGEDMYVMGGEWSTDQSNAATWKYDGTTFTQINGEGAGGTTPGTHRSDAKMVWAGDRAFLFAGNEATIGTLGELPSNVNYSLSGTTWTHLFPATLPPERFGHGMIWNGTAAFMYGGSAETTSIGPADTFDDTWEFSTSEATPETVKAINNTFGLG